MFSRKGSFLAAALLSSAVLCNAERPAIAAGAFLQNGNAQEQDPQRDQRDRVDQQEDRGEGRDQNVTSSQAYRIGFRDGVRDSRADTQRGNRIDPTRSGRYQQTPGYQQSYGDQGQYQTGYRQGYVDGYQQGGNVRGNGQGVGHAREQYDGDNDANGNMGGNDATGGGGNNSGGVGRINGNGGGRGGTSTSVALTSTPNPVTAQNPVALTATLYPFTLNGASTNGEQVRFVVDGRQVGTAPLKNGKATLTYAFPEPRPGETQAQVNAVYGGDQNFNPSNGGLFEKVIGNGNDFSARQQAIKQQQQNSNSAKTPTTVGLKATANPVTALNPVLFTASLYPFSKNGASTNGETVTFTSDGEVIGTAPLQNGQASIKYAFKNRQQAPATVVASYPGDATFQASTGAVFEKVE